MSGFKTRKITTESFGANLKRARLRKKFSLEDVEAETTVRKKYLEAFEEENFSRLPANAYAIGYLRKYCEFLGIKSGDILDQFRTSRAIFQSSADLFTPKKISDFKVVVSPKMLLVSGIVFVGLAFFGYIWYQFHIFTSAPPLKIITPNEQAMVTTDIISIAGLTDEGAKLTINNETVNIDENGRFETDIKLQDGVNTIEIVSENKIKKQAKKTLKVLAKLK